MTVVTGTVGDSGGIPVIPVDSGGMALGDPATGRTLDCSLQTGCNPYVQTFNLDRGTRLKTLYY